MEKCIENSGIKIIKCFFKSMFFSMVISVILLFVLSGILCYTDVSENIIEPCIIFISTFSILIGSFILIKMIKNKGLIYGIFFGILYMLVIYLISSFINLNFSVSMSSVIMILLGVISGGLGGIISVNLKAIS